MTNRKPWVCFEGPDGSGKTTLARAFAEENNALFIPSPSGSSAGAFARASLNGDDEAVLADESRQLVFLSDIINTYLWQVVPALAEGVMIVSDRWVMSTMAYQYAYMMALGAGSASAVDSARALFDYYNVMTCGMGPDITFHVSTPRPIRWSRTSRRGGLDINETRSPELDPFIEDYYDSIRNEHTFYEAGADIRTSVSGNKSIDRSVRACNAVVDRATVFGFPLHDYIFDQIAEKEVPNDV